ncbi:hypothetical protein Tco_0982343 [Tanacetum coccineum]
MKMEILLEPTSNKLMVEHAEFDESNANVLERFYSSAGNPIKEILLKLNLPDHRSILTDSKYSSDDDEHNNDEDDEEHDSDDAIDDNDDEDAD